MKNVKEKAKNKVKIKKKKWNRDDTELTLLALPTSIWYILFCYLPMFGIIIAFKNYRVFPGHNFLYNLLHSDWVLSNFKYLINSKDIYMLIRNTICYNAVFIVLGLLIQVTLAILISLLHSKWKSKIYQTMMFFPYFMSWVVISYFVYAFLSMDKGVLNGIRHYLGLDSIKWYMEAKYWPFILTFMQMWKMTGYNMVVYLASITGIDSTYYEAAVIDGATKWQQIKYVTLPSIKTIVVMMFILNAGRIFCSDFGLFYQIPRGITSSLYNTVSTLDTYIFSNLQANLPVGMTAAATFFQSFACFITIMLVNWIVKKIDNESAII